jgi:hypothetical protein
MFRDVITADVEDILDVTFFTDEAWFQGKGPLGRPIRRWETTLK